MGSAWWRCGESRGAREKVSAKSDGVDDENMERVVPKDARDSGTHGRNMPTIERCEKREREEREREREKRESVCECVSE